jgi:copper chaperone CopZ
MRQITLRIGGMSCDHCIRAVRTELTKLRGVELDAVDIGMAHLRFDPSQTTADQLIAAIADAGYEVLEPVPW